MAEDKAKLKHVKQLSLKDATNDEDGSDELFVSIRTFNRQRRHALPQTSGCVQRWCPSGGLPQSSRARDAHALPQLR